jgi:hypothetical protein
MTARTLIEQRSGILTIADNATITVESPVIKPSLSKKYVGSQGKLREALPADKAIVVYNFLPNNILPQYEANLTIVRYAIQGGFDGSTFLSDFASEDVGVGGILVLERGILEYNGEFDGVFKTQLKLTNRTGASGQLAYIVSIFSQKEC